MADRTALVVIDVQLGMFDGPEVPEVPGGELLLERIEHLIRRARAAGSPVIFVQHRAEAGPLEYGTEGWKIHPRVAPQDGDVVVEKRTPDSFLDTSLQEELEKRNIERLVLVGMQTEYCVDTTCRRAFSTGYDVTLVADGHGTRDNEDLPASRIIAHHNEVLGTWFAKTMESDEVRFGKPVAG